MQGRIYKVRNAAAVRRIGTLERDFSTTDGPTDGPTYGGMDEMINGPTDDTLIDMQRRL